MSHLAQWPSVIAFVLFTFASNAFSDSPLPKKFGHTFEELRDVASTKLSKDPKFGREQLVVEYHLTYNEKGACEESVREVWVSRLKDTGDQGTIQRSYAPWYQNQPSYSARVFDRNGKVYEVKEEDIIVSSIQSEDRTVLSDEMLVQAVLPGLQEGGIVEEWTVTTERTPFFKSGASKNYLLDQFVPTHYLRIEIEAPASLPLQIGVLGPEVPVVHTTKNGKQYWLVEIEKPRLLDITKLEGNIPTNQYSISSLVVTTGQTWSKIASEYSQIIDQKLQGTDFRSILAEIEIDESAPKQEQIEKCKRWIQSNIRYTSVALGSASILPVKPMQVLARRFGDCKDQSSLLVGLLRELSIEAHVVLTNSSSYRIPYEKYPSLNSFDHAIVMAKYDDREVWIDCTFPGSSALAVPAYIQGKNVLVASSKTEGLVRIPVASKEINRQLEDRTVRVSEDHGTYSSEVTTKSSGFFAVLARNEALTLDQAVREQQMTEQYRTLGGTPEFKIQSEDDPWKENVSEFTLKTKTTGLPFTIVNQSQRRIVLSMLRLFDSLPEARLMVGDGSDTKVERKFPAQIVVPFSHQRLTSIPPSAGITFQVSEDRIEEKIGPVSIRKSVERRSSGEIFVDFELTCDAGELSVPNLEQLAKIMKEMESPTHRWMAVVTVEIGSDAESKNLTASQLIQLKDQWQNEDSDANLSSYIEALFASGLVKDAKGILEEAAKRTPDRAIVFNLLGRAYITNTVGREYEFGSDIPRAEKAFRKALTLDPESRSNNHYLANCLVRDREGVIGTNPEREEECLQVIQNYQAKFDISDSMFNLAIWLFHKKRDFRSAQELLRKFNRDLEEASTQVVDWSLQENWAEVSTIRDRFADDPESLKAVFNEARHYLFEFQHYKIAGKLFEIETPNDFTRKRLGASVAKLQLMPTPSGSPTSPKEVVHEVVYSVLLRGLNTSDWSRFAVNPGESDGALSILNLSVGDARIGVQMLGMSKERAFDSLELKTKIDGSDAIGFRCEATVRGRTCALFVVKENDQYKLLLRGKDSKSLARYASEIAKRGDHAGAVKWIEWIMKEVNDGNVFLAESIFPPKSIWSSSRTKSPELVDRVLKMLDPSSEAKEVCDTYLAWIDAEKSSAKKASYFRSMLDALIFLDPHLFTKHAEEFLKDRDGYLTYKSQVIRCYMENGKTELAKERLQFWKTELPSWIVAQLEAKILYFEGKQVEGIQALKEAAILYDNEELWNSLLWLALFTEYPLDELWDECKDKIEPKNFSKAAIHTLACVKARTGAISDAMEDLNQILFRQGDVLSDSDWLILGMIAEQCGFYESAREAYNKVEKNNQYYATSAHELAKLRLKSLP